MRHQLALHTETLYSMPLKPASSGKRKQFTLDDQIERAERAAQRLDAGYFFEDEELDDERLTQPPRRLDDERGEWL